jgi:heptosyltransferase-3
MADNDDILNLLREKGAEVVRSGQSGLILQPGAIGDCVLTLPLAAFMKDCLGLGTVDILGHTEYIGILPGRTCADGIRSMDSVELHRLFAEARTFDLADGDPLITVFADYAWIVTFLGEEHSNFEQNLIFTANCSHSAEVITLSMKPPADSSAHVTEYCLRQFIAQSGLSLEFRTAPSEEVLIRTTESDTNRGRELLSEMEVDSCEKIALIQPGSGGADKCWHLQNFVGVARELGKLGMQVIFLLGPAEQERFSEGAIGDMASVAMCATDLSLTQVLGLLSCADMFVGNDSGITHLAAGAGVRTFAVFGPSDPQVYRPLGPAVTIFENATADFAKKPSAEAQKALLELLIG